jgi:hypothetical protein
MVEWQCRSFSRSAGCLGFFPPACLAADTCPHGMTSAPSIRCVSWFAISFGGRISAYFHPVVTNLANAGLPVRDLATVSAGEPYLRLAPSIIRPRLASNSLLYRCRYLASMISDPTEQAFTDPRAILHPRLQAVSCPHGISFWHDSTTALGRALRPAHSTGRSFTSPAS